ncbi:alpha/beta hydrolase [Marinilongibacter aquaticus]|uniref:alpha/beta hydrolase n=1 Tax=Marinilongibacter aquaticus TaxID=2975157 RepID=UPI0021BDC17B|nr:alpha/beta hydrolase [Marinilongibacter aquaticus]UBM59134.1 alpha/beta hydrolase [Marinilongibacter aquaticus]
MKKLSLIALFLLISCHIKAQTVIPLPYQSIPDVDYTQAEKKYFSNAWQTEVITNVSKPELLVYAPKAENRNGTAAIIAPGGGLYAHSINSEGIDAAKWLAEKGVTAFVLKYRLVPTREDGPAEFGKEFNEAREETLHKVAKVLPYSVADGLSALSYVRKQAAHYKIDPHKIGFMGFSAGGAVTMGVAYAAETSNNPDFLVPVYAWTTAQPVQEAPKNAPPMLVICATDDGLGLAEGSVALYQSWYNAHKPVAMHLFAKGGHGFGMKKQGIPADHWIERFYEWAVDQKLILKK